MKKFLYCLSVIFFIVLLSACGGSNSPTYNNNTSGKTEFTITNNDAVSYARIDIEDNSGNIQTSTPVSCPAQSKCIFKANMPLAGSLLFYDAHNTMVNAYMLADAPSEYAFLTTSMSMLGTYILSRYDQSTPLDINLDIAQLQNYFSNYITGDGSTNLFILMGKFYQYQVIGTGLSYTDFVRKLNADVTGNTVLPAKLFAQNKAPFYQASLNYLKNIHLIEPVYAQNAIWSPCSDTVNTAKTALMPGLNEIAKAWDIAGNLLALSGWGGVIQIASTLAINACSNPKQDPNTALIQKLQESINEIQIQQALLGAKIDALSNFIYGSEAQKILDKMKANFTYLSQVSANYQKLLSLNNSSYLSSAIQYIAVQNGATKGTDFQTAYQNSKLVASIFDISKIYQAAIDLSDPDNKTVFANAIRLKCDGELSSAVDLAQARNQCNTAIEQYQTYVMAGNSIAQIILKDATNTLTVYSQENSQFTPPDRDWINANIDAPKPGTPTAPGVYPGWGGGYPKDGTGWYYYFGNALEGPLKANMDNSLAGFANRNDPIPTLDNANQFQIGQGYYNIVDGLPKNLINNLVKIGCKDADGLPFIQGWIKGDGITLPSSITMRCKNKDANGKDLWVKSQYFYAQELNNGDPADSNGLINLLGIPVSFNNPQRKSDCDTLSNCGGQYSPDGGNPTPHFNQNAFYWLPYQYPSSAEPNAVNVTVTLDVFTGRRSAADLIVYPNSGCGSGVMPYASPCPASPKGYRYELSYIPGHDEPQYVRYVDLKNNSTDPLAYIWRVDYGFYGRSEIKPIYWFGSSFMFCMTVNCFPNAKPYGITFVNNQKGFTGPANILNANNNQNFSYGGSDNNYYYQIDNLKIQPPFQ